MHVVFETDQPARILGEVAAFKAFTPEIESRCEEPPVAADWPGLVRWGNSEDDAVEIPRYAGPD